MRHRLKTPAGRALYRLRKQSVEPVFGIIKQAMRFRQFLVRGKAKVTGEWQRDTPPPFSAPASPAVDEAANRLPPSDRLSGIRDRMFLAAKLTTGGLFGDDGSGEESFRHSLKRLETQRIDLLQVRNLSGADTLMPMLQSWKKAYRCHAKVSARFHSSQLLDHEP